MKKLFVLAGIGLAALSFAQQKNPFLETPTSISVRGGWVYPIDSNLRDISSSFIGIGLDFSQSFRLLPNAETYFTVDWIGRSGSGAKGNLFPILVQQRFSSTAPGAANKTYFYFGAGVSVNDLTRTKTVLAGKLGYGIELGTKTFAEFSILYTDGVDSVRGTSLGIHLGYRF
ncbi:MAG: hypothetical protein MUC92_13525 [Fimbriimonadaceae bacterium]|nr:hypothetical protein [Fimbriimonadaceae bacterium]